MSEKELSKDEIIQLILDSAWIITFLNANPKLCKKAYKELSEGKNG